MYGAEPPNKNQQRNYIIMGIAAAMLVAGLVYVAASV
jgi:hypothetical protein